MTLTLLILLISCTPILLGIGLLHIYGKNKLTISILLFLFFITVWQLSIAVLYMYNIIGEPIVLILFKLFRAGNIFAIPTIFYITYICFTYQRSKENKIAVLTKLIMSKQAVILFYVWAFIVYVISWTSHGVKGLTLIQDSSHGFDFYYPVYGKLVILFYFHMILYAIIVLFSFFFIRRISSTHMRRFMNTFMISCLGLYIFGMFNLNPNNGILIGSIGIILFSVIIVYSFIKMYNHILKSYQKVLERQSKLDYAGTITSSIVHEVSNSLTVIRGGAQLLPELQELTLKSNKIIEQIKLASDQLDQFVKGYQIFLKNESITYEEKSLSAIINKAISLCEPLLRESSYKVEVDISKDLVGNVNETYLVQVFINLIKNSVEATPNEAERLCLNIKAYTKNETIFIDFIDHGEGINRDYWDRVFFPYKTSKEKGTALGLPYCKQTLLAHRGDIYIVDSHAGGTHLQICLPQYPFTM